MTAKPIIERAYELAKSGLCATVAELERALRLEGYRTFNELSGRDLRRRLSALCRGIETPEPPPKAERRARRQTRPRILGA